MNRKGWVLAVVVLALLAYFMIGGGWFMQGDCIDLATAPPC